MRPTRSAAGRRARVIAPILGVVALLAACTTSTAPSVQPTVTPPPPTPVGASPTAVPSGGPSGAPSAVGYWLRMTTSQAIPPLDRFGVGPTSLITADGAYLVPGVVPAIYPGPLVIPFYARQVSDAGRAQIVQWAR